MVRMHEVVENDPFKQLLVVRLVEPRDEHTTNDSRMCQYSELVPQPPPPSNLRVNNKREHDVSFISN